MMLYDPLNPVVQLCVKGIETEYGGNVQHAHVLYVEAWKLASNDLELSTAAHYLARVQESQEETLQWNLTALGHALKVVNEQAAALYPSLYLNVAKSYEDLENAKEAYRYYSLAEKAAKHLPVDEYGTMIRNGIQAGLNRTI